MEQNLSNEKKNNSVKAKFNMDGGLKVKNVLSIISAVTACLCFLFLLCPGISYTKSYYPSNFNMGNIIFGSAWYNHINPGLLSAFIIMCVAIVLDVAMNLSDFCGYLSILCFITSAVLWFCTVPLYGNMYATLGSAGYCLGIFNIVDACLTFVGVAYK